MENIQGNGDFWRRILNTYAPFDLNDEETM